MMHTWQCDQCDHNLASHDADELANEVVRHRDYHTMMAAQGKAPAGNPAARTAGDEGLHKSNTHEGHVMTDHTQPTRNAITSFSGVFDFSRRIFDQVEELDSDAADYLTELIEDGLCPRCELDLPTPPEFPAGSRVTQCRSIPVCGPCGSDEVYSLAHPAMWPLDQEGIHARREVLMGRAMPTTMTVIDGKLKLVSEDGVSDVKPGPSTGGWAEYGRREGAFDA